MAKQTKKRSMTTEDKTWKHETEVRSKHTPAITAYAIGASDYNFK